MKSFSCFVKALIVLIVHEMVIVSFTLDHGVIAMPKGERNLEVNASTTVERNLLPPSGNTESELPTPTSQSILRSNICFPYFISRNISSLISQAMKMLNSAKEKRERKWLQLFIQRLGSLAKELQTLPAVQRSKCLKIGRKAQAKVLSNEEIRELDLNALPEDVQLRNAKKLFQISKFQDEHRDKVEENGNVEKKDKLEQISNQTSTVQRSLSALNTEIYDAITENSELNTIAHLNYSDDENHDLILKSEPSGPNPTSSKQKNIEYSTQETSNVGSNKNAKQTPELLTISQSSNDDEEILSSRYSGTSSYIQSTNTTPLILTSNIEEHSQKSSNLKTPNFQEYIANHLKSGDVSPTLSTSAERKDTLVEGKTTARIRHELPIPNPTNENVIDVLFLSSTSNPEINPEKILKILEIQEIRKGKSKRYQADYARENPQLSGIDRPASNQTRQSKQYSTNENKPEPVEHSDEPTGVPNTISGVSDNAVKEDDLVQQLHFNRPTAATQQYAVTASKLNPRGTINVKVSTVATNSESVSAETPIITESRREMQNLEKKESVRGTPTYAWIENIPTKAFLDELPGEKNKLDFDYEELGAAAGELEADDINVRDRTVAPSTAEIKKSKEKQTNKDLYDDELVRQFQELRYLNKV